MKTFIESHLLTIISVSLFLVAIICSILAHDWKSLIYQVMLISFVVLSDMLVTSSNEVFKIQDEIIEKQKELIATQDELINELQKK